MIVCFFTEDRITRNNRGRTNVYQCRREVARQFWYPQRIPVICRFVTYQSFTDLILANEIDLRMIYLQSDHATRAI